MKSRFVKQDNIIVRWWKLTQPNKKYFSGQIIFYLLYYALLSVITIFAAKTINCMYNADWTHAYMYLGLEILTIVLRNVLMHFEYICYGHQIEHIRLNVSKKIYNKLLKIDKNSERSLGKEKIINIAANNLTYLSEFADQIAIFVGCLLQAVLTLTIVFTSNWLAGLIVTLLGVANFFVYTYFNKKLGRIMLKRYEKKDDMFKSYSKIIDGKNVINELNGKDTYQDELVANVKNFTKEYKRYWTLYSYKFNLYFALYHIVIYAITALMLYYVSKGTMAIEIYLIIVPYLTTCTEKLCALFDKSTDIENMRVDVDRINTILNLDEEELIEYGELNMESDGYNLALLNVSHSPRDKQKYDLQNATLNFAREKINIVKGEKECGKRIIFDLIRRHEYPNKGKVLLDNLDLYDYNEKTFKTHISYCSSYPMFVPGTIKENLMIVTKDFDAIKSMCDKLNITKYILALKDGFDTNMQDVDNTTLCFMLGLVRALLTSCKILLVYELPADAPENFRTYIKEMLEKYKINKTLIFFTHSDDFDDIADRIFLVDKGRVKQIKNTAK